MALNSRGRATVKRLSRSRSRSRARRIPRPGSIRPLERTYASRLLRVVQRVSRALEPLREALPELVRSAENDLTRFDSGESERVRELIAEIKGNISSSFGVGELDRLGQEMAKQTTSFGKAQIAKQIKAALGVNVLQRDPNLSSLVESFVTQNVALIESIPEKILTDIESTVLRGIQNGTTSKDIATELEDKLEIGKKRAKTIARDQIGTLNGQITAVRHQSVGLTHFTWRTANDERVRPTHSSRSGMVYKYSDPPNGELPGVPVNCRCYAEPVFDDILDAV